MGKFEIWDYWLYKKITAEGHIVRKLYLEVWSQETQTHLMSYQKL